MLRLKTSVRVNDITAAEIFDFLADPDDESYQAWWPGTHLHLHLLERGDAHVGDIVCMDEYIGKRRVRMHGVVLEAVPGRRLVWQLRKLITLPVLLSLDLTDSDGGVDVTHTTVAGYRGPGRLLDPVLKLYFSSRFAHALDDHVKTEFPLLRDLLRPPATPSGS